MRAFGRTEGYPIMLRGLENGAPPERRIDVRSVDRGLSAEVDWDELKGLFATDCTFVISNTGDRGYEIAAEDRGGALLSGQARRAPPSSLARASGRAARGATV